MIDLREFRLKGKKIKTIGEKSRTYIMDKVYPYNVLCYTVGDNDYIIRESFSVGDLLLAGLIQSTRKKEPYGAWFK